MREYGFGDASFNSLQQRSASRPFFARPILTMNATQHANPSRYEWGAGTTHGALSRVVNGAIVHIADHRRDQNPLCLPTQSNPLLPSLSLFLDVHVARRVGRPPVKVLVRGRLHGGAVLELAVQQRHDVRALLFEHARWRCEEEVCVLIDTHTQLQRTWMFSIVNASDSLTRSILYTLSPSAWAAPPATAARAASFAPSSPSKAQSVRRLTASVNQQATHRAGAACD